jgi:hypothetical protein
MSSRQAKPLAPSGEDCPLWKKDVSKVCHKCPWYTLLRGKDPQSEEQIDEWGCAIAFGPILACEVSQRTNQLGAAIESFRNEMKKDNSVMLQIEAEKMRRASGNQITKVV